MTTAARPKYYNPKSKSEAATTPEPRCKICGKRGLLIHYKVPPELLGNKSPAKFWKIIVCNHSIKGQSKDRNDFCYYPWTVTQAVPDEVDTTYRILSKYPPISDPTPDKFEQEEEDDGRLQ